MTDSDRYILAVDTATPCSTVALTCGSRATGRVLALLSVSSRITHSRRLLVAIDRLLADSGIAKEEIQGFAVGLGPGSFTGLRIGVATVKGLASAAKKPLYGVSTLDVIAANISDRRLICSVIDARKKEVYAAFYRCNDSGEARRLGDIAVLPPDKLVERISEPVLLVGDGLFAYGQYWQNRLGDLVQFAPVQHWSPSAATLGLLAADMMAKGQALERDSVVPLYVRASDAELNLQAPSAS